MRYQAGEDSTQRELVCPWGADMLKLLDGIRACVDGDAGKALDRLLAQLAEERKKWAPDPVADDLKKLQGSWVAELPGDVLHPGGVHSDDAKCVIDGKNITLKPEVQRNPLLDLETIRGTFELSAGTPPEDDDQGGPGHDHEAGAGHLDGAVRRDGRNAETRTPGRQRGPAGRPWAGVGKGRTGVHLRAGRRPTSCTEWGEASNKVQARIRASKAKYAAGESPSFDLDVRDTHAGIAGKPWHWMAPRVWQFGRVEVDGVWYRAGYRVLEADFVRTPARTDGRKVDDGLVDGRLLGDRGDRRNARRGPSP